jgi:hypothetical protein
VSMIDHPEHYQRGGVECIDVAEHLSFNRGNALKYVWRAGEKDGASEVDDLLKAIWYLEREVARLSSQEDSNAVG